MRESNNTYDAGPMTAYGNNLPATLYRLHLKKKDQDVYQQLTNHIKELVPSIDEIMIDNDENRAVLTLKIRFKDGLVLPARSLSEGTLRFLGLAILKEDSRGRSLICLEEPENGIHPKKIKEIISLLEDMATDTNYEVGEDNPLRQVIINSHSPLVVSEVPEDCLYLASETEYYSEKFGKKIKHTTFSAPQGTWRTEHKLCGTTSLGEIKDYLSFERRKTA